jgi:hypothetical protein
MPDETFTNVNGLVPGTNAAPSREKVNGAVPVVAVTVILPLFIPKQEVGNELALALTPAPIPTIIEIELETHPLISLTTMVWLPDETFTNVNGLIPAVNTPPSNEKV